MKRKPEKLTILLILGFVLAILMILPGCRDQSETKDSAPQKQEKGEGEVQKEPPSVSKGDPESGKEGKDSKDDSAKKDEKPATADPN